MVSLVRNNKNRQIQTKKSGLLLNFRTNFPAQFCDGIHALENMRRSGRFGMPSLGFGRWLIPLALLAAPIFGQNALAAQGDTFQPYLDYAYFQESNLLRLPATQTTTPDTADTYRRAQGGMTIDKSFGRQHLSANFKFSRTAFNQFSKLDNDGKDLQANWNWHLGKNFEGNLGASYAQVLAPYTEFHGAERNLRAQRREFFDAAWRFHPSWRLHAGLTQFELEHDLASQKFGDRSEDASELGLDFLAASSSSVGVLLRHIRGSFPTPQQIGPLVIDNSYSQDEYKGKIDWRISGKSRLQLLGGWVQRKHDFFPARDTSGASMRAIADWLPTGKVGASMTAWRDINASDALTASYTLNKGVSLASNWDMLAKVRVDALIKVEQRDFSGATAFTTLLPSNRQDTSRYASLTLTYSALQNLQVGASVFRDDLSSSIPQRNFRSNGMMINLRSMF